MGANSLYKKMLALETSNRKLKEDMQKLEEKVENLPNKDDVDEQINAKLENVLETKVAETIDDKIDGLVQIKEDKICTAVLNEVKDRENRSENVIIHGIEESVATENAASTREDLEVINAILADIGIGEQLGEQTRIRRLGKREENKKRPLLIKLKDKATKQEIMENAKKLKDSESYKQVGISHDLTKIQRNELKNLREEARLKSTPEKTYIVVGPPENRKIVEKKDRP